MCFQCTLKIKSNIFKVNTNIAVRDQVLASLSYKTRCSTASCCSGDDFRDVDNFEMLFYLSLLHRFLPF